MSNLRGKFLECLKAMEDEFQQGQVQVQGNLRMLQLGAEVVPGQGIQARLSAGSILGVVEQMTVKNKQEMSVQGLEEYQLKIMDLEGKLILVKKELDKERDAGINKLKELEEELQKEKDLKLIQEEMLIKKQREVKVENESRIAAQNELSKKEIELKDAKDLIINLEQTIVENEAKFKLERIEMEKLLEKTEEELTEKQMELENETKVRVKLEQRCAELTAEVQKGGAEQLTPQQASQQQKPQLTAEEQKEYRGGAEQLKPQQATQQQKPQLTAEEQKEYGTGAQEKEPQQTAQQQKPQLTAREQQKYGRKLLNACGRGDIDTVKELLSLGVDCEVRNDSNWTPLHWAARCGRDDICQLVLDAAPAVLNAGNSYNNTPLQVAAMWGKLSVVRLLVQRGADCGLRDNNGQSALDWAVKYNNQQVVDFLTQHQ